MERRVHSKKAVRQRKIGAHMLIGAAIAGFLILSLFLEMVSSSPKQTEERARSLEHVK